MKRLLRIEAPGFVAGIEIGGRCAPILTRLRSCDGNWMPRVFDLRRWTEAQIRELCKRRRWKLEVVTP